MLKLLSGVSVASVEELYSLMTVENMRLTLVAKAVEAKCDKVERWYGTPYACTPIPDDIIQVHHDDNVVFTSLPVVFLLCWVRMQPYHFCLVHTGTQIGLYC